MKIKTDSRLVDDGDTFVAIKGNTVDGHDYIDQAIKNGATRIVCEHGNYPVETIVVEDTDDALHYHLKKFYKPLIDDLKIIGVTGTNGKTTTCFLTYQQLLKMDINACYIGTIGCFYGDKKIELANTTPDILTLYTLLMDAKESGVTHVVMEVSSHSLDLNRIDGLEFETVAFTNLTEDHLDYHKTMENYLNAKLKILNYLKPNGKIILNNDDEYSEYFKTRDNITLGFNPSVLTILEYNANDDGTYIKFNYKEKEYNVNTKLRARFNVYNYLTSVLLLTTLGYKIEDILKNSEDIVPPHGRCESVNYNGNEIVVDYAHTPDAVLKIINAFKEKNGKIITIIGCGGDRDPYKRPIMGSIATDNSYYVVFTSDNPRTEDPNKIIDDIVNGLTKDNYEIVLDRISAIRRGIDLLTTNDTLLVLGKGHEDYQIIGRTKHHLDDLEEVNKYIKKKTLNPNQD